MDSSSKVTLLALVVVLQVSLATANNYCGYYRGQSWYCQSYQYCCGTNGYSYLCCTTTPFYSWWYFWVGIVGFLFLLAGGIALCRRRQQQRLLANRNVRIATATTTFQAQQNPPPPMVNNDGKHEFNNAIAQPGAYPAAQPYPGPPAYNAATGYSNFETQPPTNYNNFNTEPTKVPPQ